MLYMKKKKLKESELSHIILEIKKRKIDGINVTVPFKKIITPLLEKLSPEAEKTQSVNTIFLKNNNVIGHNTDIDGFECAIKELNIDIKNKKIFILGAGGVVSSIILGLKNMGCSKIFISNRTTQKVKNLKNYFNDLEIIEWGGVPEFDMIINATSLGLKKNDEIKLNYKEIGSNKFFYDVIYNPVQTHFLKKAKEFGNRTENGKMMFIYQAHQAFTIWNNVMPKIDDEVIKLLEND